MTELSQLLGTLLASVARARYIADVQTAAIAEQYRDNPLLEGLSVPRVRVPELRIDLPVLIEGESSGSPARFQEPKSIARESVSAIAEALAVWGIDMPADVERRLRNRLRLILRKTMAKQGGSPHKEAIIREAEKTSCTVLQSSSLAEQLGTEQLRVVLNAVRRRVNEVSEAEPERPTAIRVNAVSGEIKECLSPGAVARLSLAIREEGLEWEITRTEDGTTRSRLGPE
ncbi:hypothetical protein [Streptomyces antimycoticus]|uniref:hypothetical protein n=1 Tax=Streptomyces antimycoticus TaxID=68175 RepID=UPI00368DE26A